MFIHVLNNNAVTSKILYTVVAIYAIGCRFDITSTYFLSYHKKVIGSKVQIPYVLKILFGNVISI